LSSQATHCKCARWFRIRGFGLEAHGGYICKLSDLESVQIVQLARESLRMDGEDPDDASLLISFGARNRVARIAYDAPHTYGRRGARWYQNHHTLARVLSVELGFAVHAYVFDPEELEEVATYADGRRVGGERLVYDDADFPDVPDEESFDRLKERWPMGRLATILGIPREELLRLPRASSVLLSLSETALNRAVPAPSVSAIARNLSR
jgi:hypothetical protein